MKKIGKLVACILMAALCLSLFASCGQSAKDSEEPAPQKTSADQESAEAPAAEPTPPPQTWAVYMYLCGSDLESNHGFLTGNLEELKYKQIPDNVKVVMESGGTTEWSNELFDAEHLQRWELDNTGYHNLEDLPLDDMGNEQTLESFLKFCHEKYPADRTMLLLWDHGGGTCSGACWDENFPDTDSLSINDIHEAVKNSFGTDEKKPPLDILMFDCCLMSTLDVAELFSDEASYLLASEEVVPGRGTNYKTLFKYFKDNPGISPEELGKKIIDGYTEKYVAKGTGQTVTFALTDLSKVHAVSNAADAMFSDLLKSIYADPDFFVDVAINALSTENYGGNTRTQGYCNLVDLRDFADQCSYLTPSAQNVIDAVDSAVIYKTSGEYRSYGGGLSIFYNYNANENHMNLYLENGTNDAIKAFSAVTSCNTLPDSVKDYVKSMGLDSENLPAIKTFSSVDTSRKDVRKNSDGKYYVDFGPEVGTCTIDVVYELYCDASDGLYYLGSDDELEADFNEGIFISNFSGKWTRLGDWIACMDLDVDTDEYNIYSMPIYCEDIDEDDLLYMQIGYNFKTQEWEELGVRTANSEPGTASSFQIEDGTVFWVVEPTLEDDNTLKYNKVAQLEYSHDIWKYDSLPDGDYFMVFRLEDVHKDTLYSKSFNFKIVDGLPVY